MFKIFFLQLQPLVIARSSVAALHLCFLWHKTTRENYVQHFVRRHTTKHHQLGIILFSHHLAISASKPTVHFGSLQILENITKLLE